MRRRAAACVIDPLNLPSDATIIEGGETGAKIYRVRDRVIKRTENGAGIEEILHNIVGYKGIAREGATSLLPDGVRWHHEENDAWIMMPDLGMDLARRDSSGETLRDQYIQLCEALVTTTTNTLRPDKEAQHNGLVMYCDQIKKWLLDIHSKNPTIAINDTLEALRSLDIAAASTDMSSVMIMDFTPDNIFVNESGVTFIDPWEQITYRGTIIPSLAQYRTNAVVVRRYSSAVEAGQLLSNTISEIGSLLGLSERQIATQYALGEVLQYCLSAYVRAMTYPEKASVYISQATHAIRGAINVQEKVVCRAR